MKNILTALSLFVFTIMLSTNAFSYNKSIDGKIGTGYASDPEQFGWQLNFAYFADLDPFFALGFEPGIYWAHWDKTVGSVNIGESVPAEVKADTNAYIIPILADAQIRLPNLESKLYVIPYATLGIGYSMMILDYSIPSHMEGSVPVDSKNKTKFFGGLTWQVMFGASYDPGSSSKIKFLVEIGYRGAQLYNGNLQVDMSGFVFNIGVKYPLGNSEGSK